MRGQRLLKPLVVQNFLYPADLPVLQHHLNAVGMETAFVRSLATMNKQQLASKIWESANKMRSKIEANEYKDYILGFIFYKFLSGGSAVNMK